MSVNQSARSECIIGINFSIYYNMKVCCVCSVESPYRGDSNEHTQYTIFKRRKFCSQAILPKGLKNELKVAEVNEPSVVVLLKFYSNSKGDYFDLKVYGSLLTGTCSLFHFCFAGKLVPLLENGMLHVSILTIIAVTTERYVAICYPFKKQAYCSDNMAIKVIIVLWFTAYACTSPFLVMTALEEAFFYDGSIVEVCRTKVTEIWQRAFVVANFVVFFALPFFILLFMYAMIIRQLMSDSIRILTKNDRCAKYTHRSRKQVVRMLIIIIILFFVSLCPIRVVTLWQIFTSVEKIESLGLEGYLNILSFARIMMYLNSSMNPVIYSLTSSKFKLAFKRVLRRNTPRRSTKRDYHLATESTTQAGVRAWRKKKNEIYLNNMGCYASCEKMSDQNHTHSV